MKFSAYATEGIVRIFHSESNLDPKKLNLIQSQSVLSPREGFGALSLPKEGPRRPNSNMKPYNSVEFLSMFKISSPLTQT